MPAEEDTETALKPHHTYAVYLYYQEYQRLLDLLMEPDNVARCRQMARNIFMSIFRVPPSDDLQHPLLAVRPHTALAIVEDFEHYLDAIDWIPRVSKAIGSPWHKVRENLAVRLCPSDLEAGRKAAENLLTTLPYGDIERLLALPTAEGAAKRKPDASHTHLDELNFGTGQHKAIVDALWSAEITTVEQLLATKFSDLMSLRNLGSSRLIRIYQTLRQAGYDVIGWPDRYESGYQLSLANQLLVDEE